MKQKSAIGLIAVIVSLLCSIQTWAGDTYYKNLSFTVHNPEPAKGRVYILPFISSDTAYCEVINKANTAKIEGNLSDSGGEFKIKIIPTQSDGYVLGGYCTPEAYAKGDYYSEYIGPNDRNRTPYVTCVIDQDTASNCTKSRPEKGTKLTPVSYQECFAFFIPSRKATIHNIKAGDLWSKIAIVKDSVNDLTVTGNINKADLKCLNDLSKNGALTRLDLSNAKITVIPDSAFYRSDLYELKLPSAIEAVGSYAFAYSEGLKPVKLPSGIVKGQKTIVGCTLMNLMGVMDESESKKTYSPSYFDLFLGY